MLLASGVICAVTGFGLFVIAGTRWRPEAKKAVSQILAVLGFVALVLVWTGAAR